MIDPRAVLRKLLPHRDALIERFVDELTIREGRAAGDERTAVFIDVLLPDVTAVLPASPFDAPQSASHDESRSLAAPDVERVESLATDSPYRSASSAR